MCLAQRQQRSNAVRLKPTAPRSQVKHSTTEPLRSHNLCLKAAAILLILYAYPHL